MKNKCYFLTDVIISNNVNVPICRKFTLISLLSQILSLNTVGLYVVAHVASHILHGQKSVVTTIMPNNERLITMKKNMTAYKTVVFTLCGIADSQIDRLTRSRIAISMKKLPCCTEIEQASTGTCNTFFL